jgi:predicted RecB family nuclease
MDSYEINDVKGIGKKLLEKLENADIKSVEQLALSLISELEKLKGIGIKNAEKFIGKAKELLERSKEGISKDQNGGFLDKSIVHQIQSDIKLIFLKLEIEVAVQSYIEEKSKTNKQITRHSIIQAVREKLNLKEDKELDDNIWKNALEIGEDYGVRKTANTLYFEE